MNNYLETENGKELYCSKILCIARNYVEHAKELNNQIPESPVFFIKPNSALVSEGQRVFLPEHSNSVHHELELAVVIGKDCKSITESEVENVILGYAVAIDLTARDIQSQLKEKSLPWELAKAFDHSCPISKVRLKENVVNPQNTNMKLMVNQEIRQDSNTSLMIHPIKKIIATLSEYFTLCEGDVILTGTPKGVGQLKSKDIINAEIDSVGKLFIEIN